MPLDTEASSFILSYTDEELEYWDAYTADQEYWEAFQPDADSIPCVLGDDIPF